MSASKVEKIDPTKDQAATKPAGSAGGDAEVIDHPTKTRPRIPGQRPVPCALPWWYAPGHGVWRESGPVLTWCPTVNRHLAAWNGRGEIVGRRFTIEVDGLAVTVPYDQVADGSVWSRFPGAVGGGGRDERQALTAIVEDQANRLPLIPLHPRWDGDALVLPPADALMRGYTDTAGTWSDWCALVRAVVDSPRIALVMGLAVGGLYVQPLGRQSYVVHMGGGSSIGKTTTMDCTASIFGRPGDSGVVEAWSGTVNSVTAQLRGLHCLPAFRDELGASGFRAEQLSALMFRVTQGAERAVSTRTGEYRESQGSWHGCVISTGNHSIVGGITNEGIAARVIEPPMPLTSSAEHADMLSAMVHGDPVAGTGPAFGRGLVALVDAKISPAEFARWAAAAGAEIPLPAGGPQRRIGEHLAMGLAGARLLGQVTGVPELVDAALIAARETLAELVARLVDHGVSPGDRLLAAVAGAVASNPGAFPTRDDYVKAIKFGNIREIFGWDITADRPPGEIAVIDYKLRKITDPAGIEDPGIALRELAARGDLVRPAAKGNRNLGRDIKANGKYFRAYHLRNVFTQSDESEEAAVAVEDQVATFEDQVATSVATSETAVDQESRYSRYISPPEGSRSEGPVSDHAPSEVVTVAEMPEPCVRCGRPCRVRRDGRPLHMDPCPPAESPVEAPEPAGGRSVHPKPRSGAHGASGAAVAPDAAELEHFRRAVAEVCQRAGVDLVDAEVPAALAAWHAATDGLRFVAYPGMVGVAAYHRLVARHGSMPDPERCASPLVEEISTGGAMVRHLDFVDASVTPEIGQAVTVHDVYAQFLAAAGSVALGDGEPARYTAPRSIAGLLSLPGYVLLGSPLDCPIPAFAGIGSETWIPLPLVKYLHSRGYTVDAAEVVVWHQHGRRLAAWVDVFRSAWKTLGERPDTASRYALMAVKEVYAAFLGGMLRSEKYNPTGTMRRDHSDQMIALAWANAFRNVDRASYGLPYGTKDSVVAQSMKDSARPVAPPMGMCRDAVWHLGPEGGPTAVPGLLADPPVRQPGKFKVEKWCDVTPELVDAHESGSAYLVRDSINAAIREGKGAKL